MDIKVICLPVYDRAAQSTDAVFSRLSKPSSFRLFSWDKCSNIKPLWWPYFELCPVN